MKPKVKKTYICRQVDNWNLLTEIPADYHPQVGDVAIFEVLHIGKHRNVQGVEKRNITIVAGDQVMAAFGTRYATAQFEGYVPEHVNQELHILGAGGTVGVIASMHEKYEDIGPTTLRIVGLATDRRGKVINTKKIMHRRMKTFTGAAASVTKVILSLGSSMDSGKTTSAAYLVHGLKKAGMTVAFIKLTGTVYTKDCDLGYDMGADVATDFSDYGFPSTYMCEENELLDLYESLLSKVLPQHPDFVVMEIADGLYERETKMLLSNSKFISTVEAVMFSAGDSLAAINGVQILKRWGIYPELISGLFTTSPLLIREVKENTSVPVYTIDDLAFHGKAEELFLRKQALASN
jgi:hypothetical protein